MTSNDAPLRVPILGLKDHYFDLNVGFFQQYADRFKGTVVADPPPFAACCKDGLLFIYNMLLGPMDVRGGCVAVSQEHLLSEAHKGSPLTDAWKRANKPMTIVQTLHYFKFPSPEAQLAQ